MRRFTGASLRLVLEQENYNTEVGRPRKSALPA